MEYNWEGKEMPFANADLEENSILLNRHPSDFDYRIQSEVVISEHINMAHTRQNLTDNEMHYLTSRHCNIVNREMTWYP